MAGPAFLGGLIVSVRIPVSSGPGRECMTGFRSDAASHRMWVEHGHLAPLWRVAKRFSGAARSRLMCVS